jgi:hypothetical protein
MFGYFQPMPSLTMLTMVQKVDPQVSLSTSPAFTEVAFMSQAIENLTCIQGEVLTREQHTSLKEYDVLKINVLDSQPVEGKTDLLSSYLGKQINLTVRRELLGKTAVGDKLYCRAARTFEGGMCEPFPEINDFRVEPHK